MKKIQMVDLQSQYYKIKSEVDNAVLNVMDSAAFINGPEVKSFQSDLETYLDVKHVIPCANGTDALQIALMALDLKAFIWKAGDFVSRFWICSKKQPADVLFSPS